MKKINLNDIPKQDPFVVPEGYLDQLPQLIQTRVQKNPEAAMGGLQGLFIFSRFQLAFTVFVFMVVASIFFQREPSTLEPEAQAILEEISRQEVVTYLSNNRNITVQELSAESDWENEYLYSNELTTEDVLEDEIIYHIDSYSAEELWR